MVMVGGAWAICLSRTRNLGVQGMFSPYVEMYDRVQGWAEGLVSLHRIVQRSADGFVLPRVCRVSIRAVLCIIYIELYEYGPGERPDSDDG